MTKEIVKLKEIKLPNLLMDTNELETYDISVTRYSDNTHALVIAHENDIIETISVNLTAYGFIPHPSQIVVDHNIFQSGIYKEIKEKIATDSQPIAYGPYKCQTELLTVDGLEDAYHQILDSRTPEEVAQERKQAEEQFEKMLDDLC